MDVQVKRVGLKDVKKLKDISLKTFINTFSKFNTKTNLQKYTDNAFSIAELKKEINNPGSTFYFVYYEKNLVGYIKLNINNAQTVNKNSNYLEIERIYTLPPFLRYNLDKNMVKKAFVFAHKKHKHRLWLGILIDNKSAINFYKKLGFIESGEHDFKIGDKSVKDIILQKKIK